MKGAGGLSLAMGFQLAMACATPAAAPGSNLQPVTGGAAALSPAELRERVQALLIEPGASAADWKRLGPAALAVLEQTVKDARAPAALRGGALEALALVADAEAAARIKAIAQDGRVSPQLRSKAVISLAEHQGRASAQPIKPVLSDPNPELREQAVRSLANVGGPEARAALEERLPNEEDSRLRELIQRSLARLQP